METGYLCKDINVNQMLLEVSENPFSDKTEVIKNLLISNKELFSQNCLDQSLLSCCREGILLLVPDIISAGANLEVTDENGNTPLLVSAFYNNESCVMYLLLAGANVNAFNFDGDTPLIFSVFSSAYIGITKVLVGCQKIKIDHANNKGYTALIYAIETVNFNAVKLLIDAIDISRINDVSYENVLKDMSSKNNIILSLINLFQLQKTTGKSSLLHAALKRDTESAQIIISMDESIVNAPTDSLACIMIKFLESIKDNNNTVNQPELNMLEFLLTQVTANSLIYTEKEMIMDIVVSIGDCKLLDRLLKFDFIISYKNLSSAVSNPEFLSFLLTNKHVINKLNRQNKPVYNNSPLHNAMIGVEIESAKSLIQHGAFMNIDQALKDAIKWNQEKALQFIISEFPGQVGQILKSPKMLYDAVINSELNIIPILLDHGADINAKYNKKYCLTQAVDVIVLELLLSRGADPNVKTGISRYTYPIHMFLSIEFENTLRKKWRAWGKHSMSNTFLSSEIKDFVECLLRYGAQGDLKDDMGQTALHIATTRYHYVSIVKLLIHSGADVNSMDNEGETPLRNAVIIQNAEMVKCLIKSGANVNLVYESTSKPVIFEVKNETILNILLKNGADVKSTDGDSPLNSLLAGRHIGTDYVKRLIDAGCDVNHVNKDGDTVLIHAAKYVDIKLLELLVQEGADVNALGRKFPYLTAITAMLSKLWDHSDRVISCINYLLDNNANIETVHSGVIHILITSRNVSLIPRFISSGLAPAYLNYQYTFNKLISPLMMALLLSQSDLALYFISINYLTKSDIAVIYGSREFKILIEKNSASKDLLKTVCRNPFSLETLCLVVISDTLGTTQDRRSKVQKLEIPQTLQNSLLFKNATKSVIKDVGKRDRIYFNQALEQLHF